MALVLWSAAVSCRGPATRSPDSQYASAEREQQQGSLDRALKEAVAGFEAFRKTPEWHWRFRLLAASIYLARTSPQDALTYLTPASGDPAIPPALEARRKMHLFDAFQMMQQPAEARRHLDEAARSDVPELGSRIALRRGYTASKYEESDAAFRGALDLAVQSNDVFIQITALNDLGYLRLTHERFDEAVPLFERGLEAVKAHGALRLRGIILGNLGWCYYRLGQSGRALELLTEADQVAERSADWSSRYRWLNNIGNIHADRDDYRKAALYYLQGTEIAGRMRDSWWLAMMAVNLADAALRTGDRKLAEEWNAKALAAAEQGRAARMLPRIRLTAGRLALEQGHPESAEPLLLEAAREAAKRGEPIAERQAHTELARLYNSSGRFETAGAEFRKAIEVLDQERSRLGGAEFKVTMVAERTGLYQEYVRFLVERGDDRQAALFADSVRARVLAEKLQRAARPSAKRATGNRVFLCYWLAPRRSYLWVVSKSGVERFDLPGERDIAALTDQYTSDIVAGYDPIALGNPFGARLYKMLIGPAEHLLAKAAAVTVVPDGALHHLNFETLIVETPQPHYWIRDVMLSVAPSLAILESDRSARAPRGVLYIGDPKTGASYPPLPNLGLEKDVVAKHFEAGASRLITGLHAHPGAYRDAGPERFWAIHFAAHAVANSTSPLDSAIVLSPRSGEALENYKLYARDILDVPIGAGLVTLSACHGAGSRSYRGEGLLGLAWAFLHAGARNVIAGLWEADDAAAVRLVDRLYAEVAAGAHPESALRKAKLTLLDGGGRESAPYYWASFELFAGTLPATVATTTAFPATLRQRRERRLP